jgi:hypothetical protein
VPLEVVSLVALPPLLYAASEELPWRDLRAVWRPVVVLAVGLVLASAAAVTAVAGVSAVPASMAFVLGAVLASTGPVAVSALGRRLSLLPRVQALVQSESTTSTWRPPGSPMTTVKWQSFRPDLQTCRVACLQLRTVYASSQVSREAWSARCS